MEPTVISRLVFVVDDEAMQRAVVARYLKRDDLEVLTFPSAEEALVAARAHPPDIIVTDVMMDGMSGIDLCACIREDAATSWIPIIVVSSMDQEEDILAAFKNGADDYMVKPVRSVELRSKVKVYLTLGASRRAARPTSEVAVTGPAPDVFVSSVEEYGKFTILEEIARGGMGVVYLALQKDLEIQVALKVLKEETSKDEIATRRFFREMRTMSAVDHPNVVKIHDVGQVNGRYYMSMERISGVTLDQFTEKKAPSQRDLCQIMISITSAIGALHEREITHRDIKPENILVTNEGRPCLIDFGLACKLVDDSITQAGLALGTPLFMAPEQIGSDMQWDHRCDFYSLGYTMYMALTGAHPFDNRSTDSLQVLFHRHFKETPQPPSFTTPELHRQWDPIVMKLIMKDPARRFQSASEVTGALGQLLEKLP